MPLRLTQTMRDGTSERTVCVCRLAKARDQLQTCRGGELSILKQLVELEDRMLELNVIAAPPTNKAFKASS